MNGDRCYHVPTSEGQSICAHEDHRMTLELTIELMARQMAEGGSDHRLIRLLCRHIAYLERRLQRQAPRVIRPEDAI